MTEYGISVPDKLYLNILNFLIKVAKNNLNKNLFLIIYPFISFYIYLAIYTLLIQYQDYLIL